MRSLFGRAAAALTFGSLSLLLAPVASAADVVVYGPGAPSAEGAARAEAVYKVAVETEEAPAGGVAHVLDLPFPSQDPIWMAGDLLQLPCADSTLASLDPATSLEAGIALVDELDYEKALLQLDQGIRALPCTTADVARQTLLDLHFFQGMAHFDLGNQAKAKRAFGAALAVNVDMPWKKEYPPAPQALFLEAKSELLSRGMTKLGVDVTGAGITSLTVDGAEVELAGASELVLYRGRHLVQYVDSGGTARAALVDVGEAGGALVSRDALRTSVLNLAWGGVAAAAGKLALTELARNRGADRAIVVIPGADGGGDRAFSFEAASGAMIPLAVDAEAVAALIDGKKGGGKKPGGKKPGGGGSGGSGGGAGAGASADGNEAGRVGLVVGGGLQLSGTSAKGLASARLHFRLVKGFEVGVGGELGVGGSSVGTVVYPLITFDVRYRLDFGVFHPYFGGRGWIGFSHDQLLRDNDEVLVIGSGGGTVGFDLTPAGTKGFVVNVDAGIGVGPMAGDPGAVQAHFTVGAGVGFRI